MNTRLTAWIVGVLLLSGCGRNDDSPSTSKRLGERVGGVVTDFATGVAVGVDKKMVVQPAIDEALRQNFEFTICKVSALGNSRGETLSIYAICNRSFDGKLLARALDGSDREIGRSLLEVKMAEGEANYLTFRFPGQMDSQLVKQYSIGAAQR